MSLSNVKTHADNAYIYGVRSEDTNIKSMAIELQQAFEEVTRELRRLQSEVDAIKRNRR